MNFGALLIGFFMVALVAGGVLFVAASNTATPVDTYGGTYGSQANNTNLVVSNVTAVGSTGAGYLVLIVAALVICAGVAFMVVYSKR